MSSALSDYVTAIGRFSKSANVERDHGSDAIDGYVPTGRALDVITRIANGLANPVAGRTFSITGPHGGGKSSLAVFLDGLLAGSATDEHKAAHSILKAIDGDTDSALRIGMRAVKAGRGGFVRAFATAQREPVAATVARALHKGAVRQFGPSQELVPATFARAKRVPKASDIRECIERVCVKSPTLLVIDEFGKNLEYFASSGAEGDPFLLQELAELTQGQNAAPLVVITMQHLSFDEYVQDSSTARRREWSKVQGRFQDIPYVETPAQSRRLIASAIAQAPEFRAAAEAWMRQHRESLESLGLRDIADDVVGAMPLDPLALSVLPDLCSRYGQNERTLFSFIAGAEPNALPRYLEASKWAPGAALPLAGVDLLYDYFLESSNNMVGVSESASRWLEIETRIRDTAGISALQLKALKTIGVLNLVSSGGHIRASRPLLELALKDFAGSGSDRVDVDSLLNSMAEAGLITYRAFSDEFRIWQGSDYDLRRVIENAKRPYEGADLADLLNDAAVLEPLVAGRHSQTTGVLRVFAREFSRYDSESAEPLDPAWDGIVYYATDPDLDPAGVSPREDGRPVVLVVPDDVSSVHEAAIDAAALRSALQSAEAEGADWVAKRELVERVASAQHRLQLQVAQTWDTRADWFQVGRDDRLTTARGISALLSDVADSAYRQTPHVANEMIARRELTSQGAKARRFLIEAMLEHQDAEAFSIEGYGPERAIYEAIFRSTGIHRPAGDGEWAVQAPTSRDWRSVWAAMNSAFDSAVDERLKLSDVHTKLTLPPIGLKDGIIPMLIIAGLVSRRDDVALYEHGSLVLALDDAVAERLTKNIGHFSVKNTQVRGAKRSAVIESLVDRLGISSVSARPTFLNVATALYRELRMLPPYSQKTRAHLSPETIAVREAFHQAAEPDVLIFETLPAIFGHSPFTGRGRPDPEASKDFANQLARSILELRDAYPALLYSIQAQLAQATSTGESLAELRQALSADAARLDGHVLEPRLKAFVGALSRPLEDQQWLENVAMVVAEGQAPRVWTDELAGMFPLTIAERGGALRRTSALLHERLASSLNQGYSSSRMTLTRPDGTESIELLVLTDAEKAAIDPSFEKLVAMLMKGGLSRSAACRMLMARLAAEHESAEDADQARSFDRKDRRHG